MKLDIGIFPPTNPDPKQETWQRAISMTMLLTIIALTASTATMASHVAWAQGERAIIIQNLTDLESRLSASIKENVDRLEVRSIRQTIVAMHARYCEATMANNVQSARLLSEIISDLQEEYFALVKTYYMVRACV